jgi:hypothetical protein
MSELQEAPKERRRKPRRILLWIGFSLVLFSCLICSSVTLYTTTVLNRPLILYVGDIHLIIIRVPAYQSSLVAYRPPPPLEIGIGSGACKVFFGVAPASTQEYFVHFYTCPK